MRVSAIIAAGGNASRLGKSEGKQLLDLAGKPVIAYAMETIRPFVDEMVLVIRAEDVEKARSWVNRQVGAGLCACPVRLDRVVAGGTTRLESVRNALEVVSPDTDLVLIHDGARPFVTAELVQRSISAAEKYGAAVVAVPVKDTIKQVSGEGFIQSTPDRHTLWAAQTPQVFRYDLLKKAYAQFPKEGEYRDSPLQACTDDSSLIELLGHKVKIVEGDYRNFKITTEEDLCCASAMVMMSIR
jgi:2-C-methyl-D-erythritol 4-phosphate cytidylyltransferase